MLLVCHVLDQMFIMDLEYNNQDIVLVYQKILNTKIKIIICQRVGIIEHPFIKTTLTLSEGAS